jgi:hypothetical protein
MSAARRAAAEIVALYAARERALRAGDATTALALGCMLRSEMERRRSASAASLRLQRRAGETG